jgi:hypothetical protein
MNVSNPKENMFSHLYQQFKESLDRFPFLLIIGKYDHILGPRALYSSVQLNDENFIRNLLRDALNTKNKLVILDFDRFYSQIYKIEVLDPSARGGKQLYAIIMLRDVEYPLIPILHFKRIEMIFHKLESQKILSNDVKTFNQFFNEISDIYMKKDEILPLESTNLQIRSGINTIQGFCDLIMEQIKNGSCTDEDNLVYLELIFDSCNDITEALDTPLKSACK